MNWDTGEEDGTGWDGIAPTPEEKRQERESRKDALLNALPRLTSESAPDLVVHYPDKLRDRIGLFMLRRGVQMGVAVDPGKVQDLIERWEQEAHPGLEAERDHWRKLAQDAINTTPTPPIVVNLDTRLGGQGQCAGCGKLTVYVCPFCKIKRGAIVWLCELAECRDRHEEAGCARTR